MGKSKKHLLELSIQADEAKTMVAELKSTPFYKPNVLAMLNTLFPPAVKELPNDRIQPKVLHQYRSSFYRYITAVEANGTSVMKAFEEKLQGNDNRHSWKNTWDNLTHYMELAEQMIKQAEVAINLGIDMFVGGNYTIRSPLGLMDRQPSNASTTSLSGNTEISFDSSFEGPATRSRTTMRGLSFSNLSFRSHSRSRANTNATTSSSPPPLPQNDSFDSVSTSPTLANTSGTTPTSSSDVTTPSISFSSTASSARQSVYSTLSASTSKPVPPLPKLDTDAIQQRQRKVSKPVMPFINPDSPAAKSEAFSSTIVMKDRRKSLRWGVDLIDRPSTSGGERAMPKLPSPTIGREKDGKTVNIQGEEKKDKSELKRPSTSHGEKTPRVAERKFLKVEEKKSRPEVIRPTTSHGERASSIPTPRIDFSSRQNRSSTVPDGAGAQTPRSAQTPKLVFGPSKQTISERRGRPEMVRPSTSHGETKTRTASEQFDFGLYSPKLRDFAPGNQTPTMNPQALLSPTMPVFPSQVRNRTSTTSLGRERPLLLSELELKRLRTVSFYDAHMDSPSMPPPLSLGGRKPEAPSPLGPKSPKRKPVSSGIPMSAGTKSSLLPLPSDGGAFLSKPFEEAPVIKRSLRKRPSFSSLFLRKSEDSSKGKEETIPEPDALGISGTPKPILKSSKSMESVSKAKVGDEPRTPGLKAKRSFGESLRSKFNKKDKASEEASEKGVETEGPEVPKTPIEKRKRDPLAGLDLGDLIQIGLVDVEVEGWKPSYKIQDQSVPRTPRHLSSPDEKNFEDFPTYVPGTVALPQREIVSTNSTENKAVVLAPGGKYGQGKDFSQEFERPEGSLYHDMQKQLGVERKKTKPQVRAKEKFYERMIRAAVMRPKEPKKIEEEQERGEMRALVRTSSEERLGPMIEDIKKIVRADEGGVVVLFEGTGEEDRSSPSDIGDEASYFDKETDPGRPLSRLRPTKSLGDLRPSSRDRKKLIKKKSTDDEKADKSNITIADISSPMLVSLPEWEEELEAELSKDYTRNFLMESARAEKGKYYLEPPKGDKKIPKTKLKAMAKMAKFQKLEAVKEETLSFRGGETGVEIGTLTRAEDGSSEVVLVEEEKPKTPKRVRILSQATREYGSEFERPRATPKPPKVPDGRKSRVDTLLWSAEEREVFRERELERQKRGTLRMMFRGTPREEDWG